MQRREVLEIALADARKLVSIIRTVPISASDKKEREKFLFVLASSYLVRMGGARLHDHVIREALSGSIAFVYDVDGLEITFPNLEFARACKRAYMADAGMLMSILHIVE